MMPRNHQCRKSPEKMCWRSADKPRMSCSIPFGLIFLLLLVFCSVGCSNQHKLADELAGATRVIVYKRTNPNEAVSISFEGEDATRIVRAVSSAKPNGGNAAPPADAIKIEFLSGTNRLAVIECTEGVFWMPGGKPLYHSDESQTLSGLETIPREMWQSIPYEVYRMVR